MKKTTRILALVLVAIMMFSVVACSDGTTNNNSNNNNNNDKPNTDNNTPSNGDDTPDGPTGEPCDINNGVFGPNGEVTFSPGRLQSIDDIATGFETSRETLIIRLDEENGSLNNIVGGYHPQCQLVWNLTGTYFLCEGYTPEGVNFMVNKYSLVDELTWDDNYLGLTLHIRDNAYFHNGDPVTADDAVFSFNLYKDKSGYNYIDFPNIKAVDDKTVYIPLNWQQNGILSTLGRGVRVFEKDLYQQHVDAGTLDTDFYYGNEGMCGPYVITEWVSGDYITMVKDEKFYVPANIDNITIRYISDNTVAMMELETGGIDVLYSPSGPDIQNVLDGQYGDKVAGLEDYSDMMMMLGFNLSAKFKDINLRYAVCHGVNWKQIVDVAWGPLGGYPTTMMSVTFAYQEDISDWWGKWYDPDKAAEYMAKTEYADTGCEIVCIINNETTKTMAGEMMNKDLAPLGITVKIVSYDTATWSDVMTIPGEDWDCWIRDFGGTGNDWFNYFGDEGFRKNTHPEFADPSVEEKVWTVGLAAKKCLDPVKQKEYAAQLHDLYLNGDYFVMFPMVGTKHVVLYNSQLRNWSRSTNNWYFCDAYFE